MLSRIALGENPLDEIAGKTIMEAMFVSIGVSIGTAQLGSSAKENRDKHGEIEMVLQKKGVPLEIGAIQFSYVPKDSKWEGWINFSEDPNGADSIYVRVVSYKRPQ